MSKRNSEDIKETLAKKFFVENNKPQDMMKAPKTKLVPPVHPKVEELSKPIEPKKQWKPPQPIMPPTPLTSKETKSSQSKSKSKEKEKFVSKYAHITDENEKKAAILAQFGVKPRVAKAEKESDSSSSSDIGVTVS